MTAKFTQVQAGPQCSGSGTVAVTTSKVGGSLVATTAGTMLLASVLAPTLTPFTPPDDTWLFCGSAPAPGGVGHVETWCLPGGVQPGGITSVSFSLPAAEAGVSCHGGLTEFTVETGAHPVVQTVSVAGGCAAGVVGATTLTTGYPGYTDRLAVAEYVDGTLSSPMATACQKFFLGDGTGGTQQYILNAGQIPAGLQELLSAGCQILLCMKPSKTLNTTDYGKLLTTVNVVQAAAAAAGAPPVWVVLWQECNGGTFGTAAAYVAYYNYYAPAVEAADAGAGRPAGYTPVGVDYATNHTTGGNYQAYYPGDEHIYFIVADIYGNTYNPSNSNPPVFLDVAWGTSSVSMMALADNHLPYPVPFGIGEFGMAQQGAAALAQADYYTPGWTGASGQPTQKPYCNYLHDLFAGRLAGGWPNGPVSWFSGNNTPEHNTLPSGDAGYDLTAGLNYIFAGISKFSPAITGTTTMPLAAAEPNSADALGYAIFANFFSSAVTAAAWTVPTGYTTAQQLHSGSPDCWLAAVNADLAAGTPSAPSGFSVVAGALGWAGMLITVRAAALAIGTVTLPNGAVGIPYSQTLAAADGTGPYVWTVTSGSLPAGLTLSSAGVISGTPSSGGAAGFTVKVTGSGGSTATQALTLTVTATAPSIITTSLPTGTVGDAYTEILHATSGVAPYTWAVIATAGNVPPGAIVPPGLTLNTSTGAITGIPTVAGLATIEFEVTDANGSTASAILALVIVPPAPSGIAELQVLAGGSWVFPQPQSVQGGAWEPATIHTVADGAWN